MTRKKKFIDKKKAITFHLSSQEYPNDFPCSSKDGNSEEWIGEAAKFGVYYDDQHEYNYLQHMREIGKSPNAVLLSAPSISMDNIKAEDIIEDESVDDISYDQIELQDPQVNEIMQALDDDAYLNDFDDKYIKDICEEDTDELNCDKFEMLKCS